jgi:sugar/nucleoside kinase (ribokinase family)
VSDSSDLAVVGLGSAIVDVIAPAEDDFLAREGLVKGTMQLIDGERAEELYAAMGPATEQSGGSVANTIAGLASLGDPVGFVGKVRDDQLGTIFTHDIRSAGVEFDVPPATAGPSTARSLILVTPDADRTMNTNLGIAGRLGPEDIDPDFVARGRVVFCEGFLWDVALAKEAIVKAMDAAHAAGNRVAFSLSDSFCVERWRAEFLGLVDERVDVLFANESEVMALYEVDDFEAAREEVRGRVEIACLTRSERGSEIVTTNDTYGIEIERVGDVVDTTGAGDLYAAGFLHGLDAGEDLATCGRMGSLAAAEVVSHIGARPEQSLADLFAAHLPPSQE